ncbi:MAG: TIGR04282 family arsenosugar biosynthesis glycosyltransferase [Hyphomicrobiales bacterium]
MKHLVIMAKAPEAGRVKTRLARQIGVAEATRVYRTMLGQALRNLGRDPRWHTWVAVAPDTHISSPVWPSHVLLVAQGAGDLGDRMQRMFDVLPRGKVLIIGSDVPNISAHEIADGFKCLGAHDAVFGPAHDGGYWLVGQKRFPRILDVFENVRWSSEHTLQDSVANLEGRKIGYLNTRRDLDTESEYRAWLRGVL